MELLLDHKADVNEYDKTLAQSDNLLLLASQNGSDEMVHILLDHGTNVKTQGGAALECACYSGHESIVRTLIDKGAFMDDRLESHHHWQFGIKEGALTTAAYAGHHRIVQLLINKGADINSPSKNFRDALDAASRRGHHLTIQVLLDNGARGTYQRTKVFWRPVQ